DSATSGTPSYIAPEQYSGHAASPASDLYAAGVTLYYTLTRRYPYGEIEPFQTPSFGDPVPPSRYRPDLPLWLESVLLKLVAREPAHRFETAEELRLALELGEARPLRVARRSPLASRSPGRLWMALALCSLGFNLLLLFVLLVGTPDSATGMRQQAAGATAAPIPSSPMATPRS
ncbi:MAG: hypothetical protein JNM11_13995, partial [Chitinimonas sp.]|nr:hypothetical protein [Chitinimonas sp.]